MKYSTLLSDYVPEHICTIFYFKSMFDIPQGSLERGETMKKVDSFVSQFIVVDPEDNCRYAWHSQFADYLRRLLNRLYTGEINQYETWAICESDEITAEDEQALIATELRLRLYGMIPAEMQYYFAGHNIPVKPYLSAINYLILNLIAGVQPGADVTDTKRMKEALQLLVDVLIFTGTAEEFLSWRPNWVEV